MAVLYQGSNFVKFNKFRDSKGNVLTFVKNTKNGKLFSTDNGYVTLTEAQASKLTCDKAPNKNTNKK